MEGGKIARCSGLEVGGMMSHGAVVAREYGIPPVVGVTGATKTIRSWDIIEVDGSTGLVRIDGRSLRE